ncbi:MAG: hypothetical protein GX434_09690 [Peptococcaceae bacterium]|nr:hypothetical protein [Peptococcaceae bacterium]
MTHTLHRKGTPESFEHDYVVFSMTAKGFNEKNSRGALQKFLRILSKYEIVNMGDMKTGGMYLVDQEQIIDNVQDTSIVHAVFQDKDEVRKALKELKEADLGVSVIVSGIVAEVEGVCQDVGIERHTVEYSVGIRGNLSRLPEEELLEITTMCGHGMVSQHLARQMLLDIKRGRRSAQEAGEILATPCVCGVFNPHRARKLLEELVEVWCYDEL